MPVPINTPVSGIYCLPLVSCLGFSLDAQGHFTDGYIDFFDNVAWDAVRVKAQEKAMAMREQGWSGAAMLPYSELEYSGFRNHLEGLLERFAVKDGHQPAGATAPHRATP
jgi:fructose 1,6-bisphosphate aldolase/phosphatase